MGRWGTDLGGDSSSALVKCYPLSQTAAMIICVYFLESIMMGLVDS